jgi:hypothetical protein
MISAKHRQLVNNQMQRDESKVVNIVLNDAQQVAGEIDKTTHEGIFLSDGRHYSYEEIKEINGLY